MPTDYLLNKIFYYVSALAGSGKTYQLVRETYRLASNGEKVVIVNPSLNLNEQDRKDLKSLDSNLPIRIIDDNNRSSSDNISDQISNFVRNVNPDKGMFLIITHQAFWNIRYWHNQSDWTLLWDEAYDITRHIDEVLAMIIVSAITWWAMPTLQSQVVDFLAFVGWALPTIPYRLAARGRNDDQGRGSGLQT